MKKKRYILLILGVAFSVTLAIVVGQRLSSEAMAVIVGVLAGVAASIPTSLIVVWVATRNAAPHTAASRTDAWETLAAAAGTAPAAGPYQPELPQLLVVQQPGAGAPPAGYPAPHYAPAPPRNTPALSPSRHYTVIGGTEVPLDEFEATQEVAWQQ